MTRHRLGHTLFVAGLAICLLAGGAIAAPPSKLVSAALSDPSRPAADLANDPARHGGDILAFSGIQPGWKVADLMQGGGYYTRLFVAAVGPKGQVIAWSPDEFIAVKKELYSDSLDTLSRDYPKTLVAMRTPFDALALPSGLDLIFTSQNYHDLHMKKFPADRAAKLNREIFRALKPGGVYLVVDHAGAAGDLTAPDRVHRMDPAAIRSEIEASGFKFEGESLALRNPADDHAKHVFDPAIRGHTDQIIYKFIKPR